jgi:hypothetical protein
MTIIELYVFTVVSFKVFSFQKCCQIQPFHFPLPNPEAGINNGGLAKFSQQKRKSRPTIFARVQSSHPKHSIHSSANPKLLNLSINLVTHRDCQSRLDRRRREARLRRSTSAADSCSFACREKIFRREVVEREGIILRRQKTRKSQCPPVMVKATKIGAK